MHEDDPNSGGTQTPGGAFCRLSEKEQEGNKEVAYDQKDREPEPGPSVAIDKEPSFFRDIGVPLEKILAEGDVTPESCKGEKEHAHNVIMLHGEESLEVAGSNQSVGGKD